MSSYTLRQKVFALSMLSNAAANEKNKKVEELQKDLADHLRDCLTAPKAYAVPYIGNWSVVWGPVVYMNNDSGVADNAMYVAQGTDNSGATVYVVCVAGTNPVSKFDMWVEDADLQPPVPWMGATDANIDTGTNKGLQILLGMTDPKSNQSLQGFLASLKNTKAATVIFAGHSLGGALAPTLALALFGGASPKLNPSAWANVLNMPTAGPTPGDGGFVDAYQKVFDPNKQYQSQTWNQNVWNSKDIVPHAWWALEELKKIYSPDIKSASCVEKMVDSASALAVGINFQQLPNRMLNGSFNKAIVADQLQYYLLEALYQHIWAYYDLLEISDMRNRKIFPNVVNPFQDPSTLIQMKAVATAIRLKMKC